MFLFFALIREYKNFSIMLHNYIIASFYVAGAIGKQDTLEPSLFFLNVKKISQSEREKGEGGGFLERTQKARGDKGIVNVISNNHNFTGRLFLAKIYNQVEPSSSRLHVSQCIKHRLTLLRRLSLCIGNAILCIIKANSTRVPNIQKFTLREVRN